MDDKKIEKFTWRIENFSKLKCSKQLYSETFVIGGHPWKIEIFPYANRYHEQWTCLSVNLVAADNANLPEGWSRDATFSLTISDNDSCIIVAEVYVPKSSGDEEHKCITASETFQVQGSKHVSEQVCTKPNLVDFRGLGKIEKAYVPLLEEVCSQHPLLIECQQKRSLKFTEWAFTALGRVLHFLKTKKGKDMNEDACKDLEIIWDELEMFRFDLTWLEPHVRYALGMKSYMERAACVKQLKETVVVLESVMKNLKLKMDANAVGIAQARRDLLRAEVGFQKGNLNAELGYGIP